MSYVKVDRANWKAFFDVVSNALAGRFVEFEVASLDLGDQIEAGGLELNGFTYDPVDNAFYLSLQRGGKVHLQHTISAPEEIWVEIDDEGLSHVVVIEPNGRKQFVHLRLPLALPAMTER